MNVKLTRFSSGEHDTLSVFHIDDKFGCFMLEDEHRDVKLASETRIPAGTYDLVLRSFGGFHQRYLAKFGPEFHKGMIEIKDVPNFTNILIHIGNDEDDTAGCLLTGSQAVTNVNGKGKVLGSTDAYKHIYPILAKELISGRTVKITIKDQV